MSMRAYAKYRTPPAEWIGSIPSAWDTKRLKYCARLINEKVDGRETDLPYTGLEHIESWTGKRIDTEEVSSSDGQSNSFRSGDVLFGKLRPYLAKVLRASEEGICTGELLVIRPNSVAQDFLFYYMLARDFMNVVDSSTYGAKMPRASWDFIGDLPVVLPFEDEQRAIAGFLDRETAKIDSLVAKKERLIEVLQEKRTAVITYAVTKGLEPDVRMKDSGVEWLGEIPAGWEVRKVSHVFKIGSGTTPRSDSGDYYGGDIPWVTTSELRETVITETNETLTEVALRDHSALKMYPEGSLLVAMYGATIGRLGLLGIPATVNQACCVFTEPKDVDARFVFYWFQMRRPVLISLGSGGGQPNLSQDILRSVRIALPDLLEQRAIVTYLDEETAKTDSLIAKIREGIDRLKEYRTALISAAVTGKIDVRKEVA